MYGLLNGTTYNNPDFKGMRPLFDVEYLRNDTRLTRVYYSAVIESDMWSIELCHRNDLHQPSRSFHSFYL